MSSPIRSRKDSEDDDDIFYGSTTKREIVLWLKAYNLLLPEYLEPLNNLQNTDILDDDLLNRYWNILKISSKENSQIDNSASVMEDSLHIDEFKSLTIEDSCETSLNDESQWTDVITSNDDNSIILVKTESMNAVEDDNSSVQCDGESIVTIKVEKTETNHIKVEEKMIDLTVNESLDENKSSDFTKDVENASAFNDTLDDMEMLIQYGENYMQKKEEISNPTQEKLKAANLYSSGDRSNKENAIKVPSNSVVTSFENEDKKQRLVLNEKENIINSKTPEKSPRLNKPRREFKIPIHRPLSARKSPNFNHIVSPISLYIKNSPQVPLVFKVSAPTNHVGTFKDPNAPNTCEKELDAAVSSSGLPTRSYKPSARNIFISKEVEPSMPGSVRKLIKGPLGPEIIKHVGRIKNSEDLPSISAQTVHNDAELTILSSSSDDLKSDFTTDVSLYILKKNIKK